MAIVHVLGVVASGLVSVAFASSLFFSLSPSASRGEVLRYVVISLIPMAALGPVLGPLLDRRMHDPRRFVAISNATRALCCVALALTLNTPGFFVAALALLVANKAFSVGRQALLPELVRDPSRLVSANAGLARLGAASGVAATALGVASTAAIGAQRTLLVATLVFALAGRQASRIHDVAVHHARPTAPGRATVDRRARVAAATFALVRGAIAVWALGLAFAMRRDEFAVAAFGLAAGAYSIGSLAGNVIAARLVRGRAEETLIAGTAAAATVAAVVAAVAPAAPAFALSGALLGFAGSSGRLAFESVLQATSAPGCRGRVYARLETGVQLAWAFGAAGVVAAGLGVEAIGVSVALLLGVATVIGSGRRIADGVGALATRAAAVAWVALARPRGSVAALVVVVPPDDGRSSTMVVPLSVLTDD